MSANNIRKVIEKVTYDSLSTYGIYIDFNEEGGDGKNEFVRVNSPFIITQPADIGSKLLSETGSVTIQVFAMGKNRCLEIYDILAKSFNVGKHVIEYNTRLNVTSISNDFAGRDSAGRFYQVNFSIEFYSYEVIS